jgi:SAM-dependent methyltransferase
MLGTLSRAALLAAACALLALSQADEESIWKEFLDWYRAQPANVQELRTSYLASLKSRLPAEEAERRFAIVERLAGQRRNEVQPIFFDKTYTSEKPRFNTQPNAWLVANTRDLPPGRALDVHMGQGRNALYLASKGWDVAGFDFSVGGVRSARRAAEKAGLKLHAVVGTHEAFSFGRDQWDLIVMSYTWVPVSSEHTKRIAAALKPGGLLIFEHFLDETKEPRAGWSPKINELLTAFADLRILRYEDVTAVPDWGDREARIVRMVARKRFD